jgi:hypothetical protein
LISGKATDDEGISPARLVQLEQVRAWSLERLTPADVEFIASFQPTVTLHPSAAYTLLCYHGSPRSFSEILLPDTPYETFVEYLGAAPGTIYAGGHTHVQFTRRVGATFHFNPGSVGMAYSHHQDDAAFGTDAVAEYAVLTVEGTRTALEFRRVPYDVEALIEIYRASGRPYTDEAIAQYRRGQVNL